MKQTLLEFARCCAITKKGSPCSFARKVPTGFCGHHRPGSKWWTKYKQTGKKKSH